MKVKWVCQECNSINICEKSSEMKCFVCGKRRTDEALIDPKSVNPTPPTPSQEESLEELFARAWECDQRGNMEEAAKLYRQAAERGHRKAQNNLGVCYRYGQGVAQDLSEAARWIRRAAEQENLRAQCNLGAFLLKGIGVAQNAGEAVRWFRRAADQGYAEAQNWLGVCYANGEGVPQNHSEATRWYSMAADQGDAYAQNNLSRCYENGVGVPKDLKKAVELCRKAAAQRLQEAEIRLPQLEEQLRHYLLDSSTLSDSKAARKKGLYRPENTTAERCLLILGWVLSLSSAVFVLDKMYATGEFLTIIIVMIIVATYFLLPILRRQYCLWNQTIEDWKPTRKLWRELYELWTIFAELCSLVMVAFPILQIITGGDPFSGNPTDFFIIGFNIYYIGCFIWRRGMKKRD